MTTRKTKMNQHDLITIPARHGKAATLKAGQSLRLINTHGTQVHASVQSYDPKDGA